MRLPDEVLKCVVFIGQKRMNPKTGELEERLTGSGFFISIPTLWETEFVCLVTARHIAEPTQHGDFFIRANLKDGTSKKFWLSDNINSRWVFHPTDPHVDAAILLWTPPEEVEHISIPQQMVLTKKSITEAGI